MATKQKMARVNVDLLVDRRALEFVLGAIESAEICDLPSEVAEDVCFIRQMLAEKLGDAK